MTSENVAANIKELRRVHRKLRKIIARYEKRAHEFHEDMVEIINRDLLAIANVCCKTEALLKAKAGQRNESP